MLLGFDATTIRGNMTGVGYYSARLLERLTRVGGEGNPIDEVLVLSNRELSLTPAPRTRPVTVARFPLRAPWMQGLLPLLLRRYQPDLCHFTNFLAPYFTSVPYVVTIHDMTLELLPRYHTWRKRALTRTLSPGIARRARFIVTPSESARADVARLFGVDPGRIRAIPHAADPRFVPTTDAASRARIRERYGVEDPYLLYVGTLEPRKNLVRTVRAFARIADRFPEHRLFLAGELGWHANELLETVASLRMGRRVVRLGYVDEDDLPALYANASLFLYPSLYEGFGFPVLEAMACGVPVLTSRTSSLAELAAGAALTVNPFDEREITETMERGLADEAERRRLREAGSHRARQFSWHRTVAETLSVYQEALERVATRVRSRAPARPVRESAKARAILDTLAYGAVFDYPMTLDEIHRSLMQVRASKREIARLLRDDPFLLSRIDREGPFYHLSGEAPSVASRRHAEQRTRALLTRNERALAIVRKTPFVRMVALSGAAAHGNARDDDIDLFLVTAPGRTWTVALVSFVVMKLLRRRRALCMNYFVGTDRVALSEQDAFTANQLVGLKPLAGRTQYLRLLRANDWGARFFPNFWQRSNLAATSVPQTADEPGSLLGEAILSPVASLVEGLSRRLLGWYLRRQHSRVGRPASVKLEPDLIKLHFNDHGAPLNERIASIRNAEPWRTSRPPGSERPPSHARVV